MEGEGRQRQGHTEKLYDGEVGVRWVEGERRQTNRQTDRQTDRQTEVVKQECVSSWVITSCQPQWVDISIVVYVQRYKRYKGNQLLS